ncbi:MAG: serine/threonine protein kinase [Verrucomicrobia bacterium]|nr:serine/threonine protein kinase [Verrucomicrobiota bacterium]
MRKIEALLLECLTEIPDSGERSLFLDWACRSDADLRSRMKRLLESREHSARFFDFAPFEACEPDDGSEDVSGAPEVIDIGLRIGKYRLVRRLGAGGCGVVYLAEQETPVKRQVALKLIRVGLDHGEVIRRFKMERQALAMMDHPGIARVLDAGATVTGRPYFVMQWVTGERITDFCDKHRLSVDQRLELFIRVCHAIQHAHQKGVIHRDIKPSNVLVSFHDGVPLPKVIDFGIAKATGVADANSEAVQEYVWGTPNYMSPEQGTRGGSDVDTRTDIFSLGVLLCELLTGSTPFAGGPGSANTVEMRRGLLERVASAPGGVFAKLPAEARTAVASNRSCGPHELARKLRGDLDAIVMKCVRRDPTQRYNTASGLAVDVRHHLDNDPVGACSAGRRYRLGKLVRRNKLVFATGAVVFATLAMGFGTSTWLFLREKESRREQARQRALAEQSRAAEAALRERAEAGEVCAHAAVRLFYGDLAEADRIVANIPEDLVPPSLEAADLFSKLGDWHLAALRWPQASKCFSLLVESKSSVDTSDTDSVSRNLLPAVAAACEAEDWNRYERLRKIAVQRFGETRHPVVAEQIVKVSLLKPADPSIMARLAPLGGFISDALAGNPTLETTPNLKAWACFSMALWDYRKGEFETSIQWAQKSLDLEDKNPARVSSVKLLLAMVHFRMGRPQDARDLLHEAAPTVRTILSGDIQAWSNNSLGIVWPDWANAHVLLNEAETLIGADGNR